MINVLLAYDNQDEKSGDFFALCRNKSLQILQEKVTVVELDSMRNSLEVFAMEASKMNQQDFFFLAFVHGCETELRNQGEPFVSVCCNHYMLSNAVVYTFSCKTGVELADILLANGTKVFWGYTDSVWYHPDYDEDFADFADFALMGLKCVLNGEDWEIVLDKTKLEMNKKIDEWSERPDTAIAASLLRRNRDAHVLKLKNPR